VQAKNGVIFIHRLGLEMLRTLQTQTLLVTSQRNIAKHILMRGPKVHEVRHDHTLRWD